MKPKVHEYPKSDSKSMSRYFCLIALLFLFSCDDNDDNIPCSGPEVNGLDVVVKDAVTSEILTFGVVVEATEGSFTTELIESGGHFTGLPDQEGIFGLTVTKSGYQTYTENNVFVVKPGCHSVTTNRIVNLQPE